MSVDPTREPTHREPVREREVIVTDGNRGGPGGVLAVLLGVAALVLVAWLLITNLGDGDGEVDAPAFDVPEQIDVNVNDGDGS